MWVILPILLVFLPKSFSHVPVNETDVLIIGEHADLHRDNVFVTTKRAGEETTVKKEEATSATESINEQFDEKGDIVFVPTEREYNLRRNEDAVHEDLRLTDLMDRQPKTTESSDGVVFITGKNQEKSDTEPVRKSRVDDDAYIDYMKRDKPKKTTPKPLDCDNLDCDNIARPICAVRKEVPVPRHRLFKNECYLRKVNCKFEYEFNRFTPVELNKCKNAGIHNMTDNQHAYDNTYPYQFIPPMPSMPSYLGRERPILSGRRAMSINLRGIACGHTCPVSCTEHHDPECALSADGQRKVFLNHCQLDLHSCTYGVLWQKRPLSECVGGRRADMENNKSFIHWMQRAGIVDKKGRLTLTQ